MPDEPLPATLSPEQQAILLRLYATAEAAKPAFDATLERVARELGQAAILVPLKQTGRAVAKIAADYAGKAARIKDLLRGTILVDTPEQARQALALIEGEMNALASGRRDYMSGDPGPDGYRDIKLNVVLAEGLVAEVQIGLRTMVDAKQHVHHLYAERSTIRRSIVGNDPTPDQLSRIELLNQAMRQTYSAAWTEGRRTSDTIFQNASSEIAVPLRSADSGSNARGGSVSHASEYLWPGSPMETGISPSMSKNSAIATSNPRLASRARIVNNPHRLWPRLGKSLAVVALLVWSLSPIALMAAASFKPRRDIFATPFRWAFTPTLDHYRALLVHWPDFFRGLWNSLLVTAGATVLAVLASTASGYALSRFASRWSAAGGLALIAARLIPPLVCTLPLFPLVNALGLADTHLVLILLYASFFVSLGTHVMRAFIDQVPRELDEAASVDGAGRWTVLLRVVAPVAAPGMLAVAVFVIVYAWNEYLFAFIFTSRQARTAPLVLADMIGNFDGVDWGVLFAASTVQLVPVMLFVIAAQKHLVAGLSAGATKG